MGLQSRTKIRLLKKGQPAKKGERETPGRGKNPASWAGWFSQEVQRWITLAALSLTISILLFPNILTSPRIYKPGDIAERDIKASRDFLIEDRDLTEKNRQEALKKVLSVYDFDASASSLLLRIKEAFSVLREYSIHFSGADAVPDQDMPPPAEKDNPDSAEDGDLLKARFYELLEIAPDETLFKRLAKDFSSIKVEENTIQLITQIFQKGVVGNRTILISQGGEKGVVLHDIQSRKEMPVTDLTSFFDIEGARAHIGGQRALMVQKTGSPELADQIIAFASSLIKPNLTFNKRETELRKDIARTSAKPFYFKIKKGEMLVREGERIEPDHILKLSEERRSLGQGEMLVGVPGMFLLIGTLLAVVLLAGMTEAGPFRQESRDLIFHSVILLTIFIFTWTYDFIAQEVARGFHSFTAEALFFAMPVACGAMLITVFQGFSMAVSFSLVISVLASLIIDGRIEFFIYFFLSSLVAAYGVRDCKERGILIKTGVKVGFINIILSLSIEMIYGSVYTFAAVMALVGGFIGGILAGVISAGIIPLLELCFGFTTDIKLLELASLDQPLLRDLMVQAPGTYHHSVIVSNMVEATAKAIKANPLLAKVSAYYHDIGKIKKPLYFIENQRGGENKHEKLAPSMSSLILISHVKDGMELAKSHKLGREIINIIQQHHGKNLISYFYQKAKEQEESKGGKSIHIDEQDFRYHGPKPQTKEAGLVMLADMVEASIRSLADPNPARIQGIVQRIINKVFSDGQLDDCELTLKDLHEIARSFNNTLAGIFHQRVQYPEMLLKTTKKAGNGNTDHVSAEDSGIKKSENKGPNDESLKRLGQS